MESSKALNQQLNKQLEERLQFEKLITNLSARFINLPANEIDQQIDNGLKLVVEALQVDRSSLFQFSEDGTEWLVTNSFANEGFEVTPRIPVKKNFPWIASKIQHGEIVPITSLNDLPEEAAFDRKSMERINIKSTLVFPISIDGSIDYVLTLGSLKRERSWDSELIPRLQLIGEVFANALMRKRLDGELNKSNEELNDRLRFEEFISNLSSHFVNLLSGNVEHQIENGLKQLVEFLKIDRSSLLEFSEDYKEIITKYTYAVKGVSPGSKISLAEKYHSVLGQLRLDKIVSFSSPDELPENIAGDFKNSDLIAGVAIPLSMGNSQNYGLTIGSVRKKRDWPDNLISRLKLVGEIFVNALERKKADEKINTLLKQIKTENIILREEINLTHNFENIIGESNQIKYILHEIEKIAPTDTSVLILGETGTGKELIARAIHSLCTRKEKAFITVDCASLPFDLIESELFGHEKGAFTGAHEKRIGRFEIADGSTIFLDEIGELPIELQSKLLRIIESGEYERLGSSTPRQVDVRILAATNRNIEEEVNKGNFRQDLFYRLNMMTLTIPPLRERKSDIILLVNSFIKRFCSKHGKVIERIPKRTIKLLQDYHWPGNIRELQHVIERAIIISEDNSLKVELKISSSQNGVNKKMVEIERDHILRVLENINWRIKGTNGAAEILGLKPSTLRDKMKKLGINRPG